MDKYMSDNVVADEINFVENVWCLWDKENDDLIALFESKCDLDFVIECINFYNANH